MWRHVGLVRTDVSEECVASIFRVERICKLASLLVTVNIPSLRILSTLKMKVTICSKNLVLTRTTQHLIPEEGILDIFMVILHMLLIDGLKDICLAYMFVILYLKGIM
jgi:hypothetical protein